VSRPVKVYVIVGQIGKNADYRTFNHRVYLSRRAAEAYCLAANERSDGERRQLALVEKDRIERLTGRVHPLGLNGLVEQFFGRAPHYEVEDHEVVVSPENPTKESNGT
jgi:hypothetical protein